MCYNGDILAYVVNCAFFYINLFLLWSVAYIFIAHDIWRNADKIRVLIHSPFCVMNFMLPACIPNSPQRPTPHKRLTRGDLKTSDY